MVQAAVMGYGTVGSGVVEVLNDNQELIDKKACEGIRVKYVLDLRDFPGDPIESKITHDFNVILNDPEIKVVAEVMGGLKPAYEFTKQLLLAGKSVCTSNKELVAAHGQELIEIAKEKKVNYLFEASCGGGIPVIRALNASLTADSIDEITGILNGTTNYILTEMADKGADFTDVLKQAQEKGYAERNPEADVEGYDACRKIAILSSLAFGNTVSYEDIYTEGITKISTEDISYAKKLNMSIKLLASSRIVNGRYYAMVAPFLIPSSHPLYSVNGVFNAIFVHGNMLGDAMFYGSGAGKLPTASAVVGDMVDAVKHLGKTIITFWDADKLTLSSNDMFERRFLVRIPSDSIDKARRIFGDSVDVIMVNGLSGECAFTTPLTAEKDFAAKADELGCVLSRIRYI